MRFGIRQLIFLGVLLAVPLASFFMVFQPQNRDITRAKGEIGVKRAMLEKLRTATAQNSDLEKSNAEMKTAISAIEARLPSDKEVDMVLRDVAQTAARCGLKLPKFQKTDKALAAGLAVEQPLSVELTGDFDGFYKFLLELEKLPRITRIPDLKVTRAPDTDGNLKAEFTLSIYYQSNSDGNTP